MFYVHIDIFTKFKYSVPGYLIKAFYCNFSMYDTLYYTCIYNRVHEDEPLGSKLVKKKERKKT